MSIIAKRKSLRMTRAESARELPMENFYALWATSKKKAQPAYTDLYKKFYPFMAVYTSQQKLQINIYFKNGLKIQINL